MCDSFTPFSSAIFAPETRETFEDTIPHAWYIRLAQDDADVWDSSF
jgi:hypothetical protein